MQKASAAALNGREKSTYRFKSCLRYILSRGVIDNTSDFGSEESTFEPWRDNDILGYAKQPKRAAFETAETMSPMLVEIQLLVLHSPFV